MWIVKALEIVMIHLMGRLSNEARAAKI